MDDFRYITSLGGIWNKIDLSTYEIDSETHFCYSRSYFLMAQDLTVVGEKFLA